MIVNAVIQTLRSERPRGCVPQKGKPPFYFTIDLMLTENDEVKILELNNGFHSGFKGYEDAYGEDYKGKLETLNLGKHGLRKGQLNDHLLFQMMLDSKFIFDAFVPDVLRPLLPKTKRYAVAPGQSNKQKIKDDFKDAAQIVVKGPTGVAGAQVFILSLQRLLRDAAPSDLRLLLNLHKNLNAFAIGPANIVNGVAQEVIRPKPLEVEGKDYLGTIRVGVIALPQKDGSYTLEITGHEQGGNGYYKLPNKPAPKKGGTLSAEALKSDVYSQPYSARLDNSDLQIIKAQLDKCLAPALKILTDRSLEDLLRDAFESEDITKQIAALVTLIDLPPPYWGRNFSDIFYEELVDPLKKLCLKNPYVFRYFDNSIFATDDEGLLYLQEALQADDGFLKALEDRVAEQFYGCKEISESERIRLTSLNPMFK